MTPLFQDIVNAERNVQVSTEEFTVPRAGTFAITNVVGATGVTAAVQRGDLSGSTIQVSAGDRVRLIVRTSNEYSDTTIVTYTYDGKSYLFGVTTKADDNLYQDPAYANIELFNIRKDKHENLVKPSAKNNRVVCRSNLTGPVVGTIDLSQPNINEVPVTWDEMLVPSYFDGYVHVIDRTARALKRSIKVDGQPYAVARVAANPSNPTSYNGWVTLADRGLVVMLNSNGNIVGTFYVGGRPTGIAVNKQTPSEVWVSLHDSNRVVRFSWTGSAWEQTSIEVGNNPTYVIAERNTEVYVTCTNGIYRVVSPTDVRHIPTEGPRQCAMLPGSYTFAASIYNHGGVVFHQDFGTQTSTYVGSQGSTGYAVCPVSPTRVAVSSLGQNRIDVYDVHTGRVSAVSVDGNVIQMEAVGSELWAVEMWQGLPSTCDVRDTIPHPVTMDFAPTVRAGATLRTGQFEVTGLDTGVWVTMAATHGGKLVRNGVEQGTNRVYVNRGEKLGAIAYTPEVAGVEVEARVYVGGAKAAVANSVTFIEPIKLKPFGLDTVVDAELNTSYTSNEVTIEGIEPGQELLLTVSNGVLIVNGVEQGSLTANVVNGDRFAVRMPSANTYTTPVFCTVRVGAFEEIWSIMTKSPAENTYYSLANEIHKTIFDMIPFGSIASQVDTSQNKVKRFSRSTLAPIAEYPLTGEPNNNGAAGETYVFVSDPVTKSIIQVDVDDPSGNVVDRRWDLEGMPFGITPGPMVAFEKVNTSYYAVLHDKAKVVNILTGQSVDLQSWSRPMAVTVNNYNEMYVTDYGGFIHTLTYNEQQDSYQYSAITSVPSSGNLVAIISDDNRIYVADSTGYVHIMSGRLFLDSVRVGRNPSALAQSGTHVYVAGFGTATVSMFSKADPHNTLRTVELPPGASQPNAILYDSQYGRVFVGCSRSGKVYVLNANDLSVQQTLDVGPVWGLQVVNNDLLVLNMWGNLLEQFSVGYPRQSPGLEFFERLDATMDTQYSSNVSKVTASLPMPERVWMEPFADAVMLKNGVAVGWETTVQTNDTITVQFRSNDDYDSRREVYLFSYSMSSPYVITTEKDIYPDLMYFDTLQDIDPRERVLSEILEVTGVAEDADVLVRLVYSIAEAPRDEVDAILYVNGEPSGAEAIVHLGDELQVGFMPSGIGWNGSRATMYLENAKGFRFGFFSVRTRYLEEAYKWPFRLDRSDLWDFIEYDPNATMIEAADREAYRAYYQLHELGEMGTDVLPSAMHLIDGVVDAVDNRLSIHLGGDTPVANGGEKLLTSAVVESDLYTDPDFNPFHGVFLLYSEKQAIRNSDRPITFVLSSGWDNATVRGHWSARKINDGPYYTSRQTVAVKMRLNAVDMVKRDAKMVHMVVPEYELLRVYSFLEVEADYQWNEAFATFEVDAEYQWNDAFATFEVDAEYQWTEAFAVAEVRAQYMWDETDGRKIVQRPDTIRHFWSLIPFDQMGAYYRVKTVRFTLEPMQYNQRILTGKSRVPMNSFGRIVLNPRLEVNRTVERKRVSPARYSRTSEYYRKTTQVFDSFSYTADDIRAFADESAAVAAGLAGHYDTVFTHKLFDSTFMWHVPAEIERTDCPSTDLGTLYVRGYVQGG